MHKLGSFYVPALLVVVTLMSFYRLGSVSLFDVDEAVFAQATKEMVQGGDWTTPTYNGENRYDKPILFYWLMAASYKIFGINEFGARFPSAFAGMLLSLSLFFFVRRCTGRETALYVAASFVLSLYFFVYSHAAVTDMTLTLFTTLSLFSFFLALSKGNDTPVASNLYLYGFYLFSALAFLTKGLIGIVFPFCIAAVYLIIIKGYRGMGRLFSIKAIALFLLVSVPWYAAEFAINGKEFFDQFFMKHHFMRYTGVISGHRGPFFYYIPVLIVGLFPWIAFLPAGIRDAAGGGHTPVVSGKSGGESTHDESGAARYPSLSLFALIWLTLILVFFSFSTTKLPNYILPAIPAASMLIGAGMAGQRLRWSRYSHGVVTIAAVLTGIALILSKGYLVKFGISDTGWTSAAAVIMFMLAAVSVYALLAGRRPYGYMSVLMVAFLLLLSVKALPLANQKLQGTLYKFSLTARESLGDRGTLITMGINNPSIVFYSDHRIKKTDGPDDLLPIIRDGKKAIIIARSHDLEILEALGLKLLSKDDKYALLETK